MPIFLPGEKWAFYQGNSLLKWRFVFVIKTIRNLPGEAIYRTLS